MGYCVSCVFFNAISPNYFKGGKITAVLSVLRYFLRLCVARQGIIFRNNFIKVIITILTPIVILS